MNLHFFFTDPDLDDICLDIESPYIPSTGSQVYVTTTDQRFKGPFVVERVDCHLTQAIGFRYSARPEIHLKRVKGD